MTHTNPTPGVPPERPDWLRDLNFTPDTLPFHLSHPDPLPDQYIRAKHIELGAKVMAKRRVYLDQNYWIYCRDAAHGTPKSPTHARLYKLLGDGVTAGRMLCPASHPILEETLKQTDPATRLLTAEVVQQLSSGIAMQPFNVLSQVEVLHFLRTGFGKAGLYPAAELAWTHVTNVFGHPSPVVEGIDEQTLRAIQKAWFDFVARLTFPMLVKALGAVPNGSRLTPAEFYDRQNAQCEEHKGDFSSFKQAFMIELAGALDVQKPELSEALVYLYEKHTGLKSQIVGREEREKGAQEVANLIYHAFRLDKITTELPGLRIMVGIHAAARHKGQKYRPGDLEDHLHARVALPYCDLFLTEKNLGHLLTTKPLAYDALYRCRVIWEPEAAVSAVEALLS